MGSFALYTTSLAHFILGTRMVCFCHSLSPSSAPVTNELSSPPPPPLPASLTNRIDSGRLVQTIRSGRVYQQANFLSAEEMNFLFADINRLLERESFQRSGLSDTSRGKQQGFGHQDRSVSPIPWWIDALQNKYNKDNIVAPFLNDFRHFLADALERPTLKQNDLAHECYYSISGPGSFLPRHMDDKHEDLKGSKGWILPSRRSLSWLLYLSDADWTLAQNGGALRSFPPMRLVQPMESAHEGNLQIGWLHADRINTIGSGNGDGSLPVYMDTWFRNGKSPEPHAVLYTVSSQSAGMERIPLTKPWLNDNLPANLLPMDFMKQMAAHDAATTGAIPLLFLRKEDARRFCLIEDREAWDQGKDPSGSMIEDTLPLRGSLIIFDSILLPHQVELVKQGQRIALAGWFHERTQEFPSNFYGTTEL